MSTQDVPRDEAALLGAARRAQAAAASLQSPAHDIQATLRDLHTALLSTDTRALRRSVGFFGRLLGSDIDLQARSEDLRARLALLVQQARQRGEALDRHNHALAALRDELTAIAEGLAASITSADPNVPASHERQRMLDAVRTGCALTAAQLDRLAQNGHALAARYRHMLPTVEGLLVQHRATLAGQQDAAMLRDAAALVASVEAAIPANAPTPSEIQSHVVAKESP
jgi:fused signal recognition particle receptor